MENLKVIGKHDHRRAVFQTLLAGPVDVDTGTPVADGGPDHVERALILFDLMRAGVVTPKSIKGMPMQFELTESNRVVAEEGST